jgi:transposase-like protein
MIGFPIAELLDESTCTRGLERHRHPEGLSCPHCGQPERRLFREQAHFPAYRCRAGNGYYTLLTGTVFAKTRQRPATLVLLLRGGAKGEPTARLARALGLSRKQLHTLRHRSHAHVNDSVPTNVMGGTAFEADDGDGRREVHGNTCEGAGAALRTYLRVFRGVHKHYLHLYVATYEAIVNAKRATPELIQCVVMTSRYANYT